MFHIELGLFLILLFLAIVTPHHRSKISNICCFFLIINHKCLMNFILDYHKHGYSKKSSHISGWVSDFWTKHTRHCTYRVPPGENFARNRKKNTSVGGYKIYFPQKISPPERISLCHENYYSDFEISIQSYTPLLHYRA